MRNKILLLTLLFPSLLYAKSPTTTWDSDIVENYLNQNKGATLNFLTDLDNDSRWYFTGRLKSGIAIAGESGSDPDQQRAYVDANLRLRGKSMITDDIGFVGDFWLKAIENYTRVDGETVNSFDGFDDHTRWEQFRFGLEHEKWGSLLYAKHTTTWALFVMDMGSQGLYFAQGDAGGKNAEKIIYKNQFDNNLFLNASYDTSSRISGLDIGYQTSDLYSYLPDSYGAYFSVHNGQPAVDNGYGKTYVGNVDPYGKYKSDTANPRKYDDLYTYSLSAFKQFAGKHRLATVLAYSKMDDDDSVEMIEQRGYAEGGLGFSSEVGYQYLPAGGKGFSPLLTAAYTEFGESITPELQYWFMPGNRIWLAHTFNSHGRNVTRLEYQWDF
ncbi:hypothetical protein [Photobacterium rosenbergii]|uniref:Porin n=1 Tax=Photobacterium rosenbergii TaxID=294936 RepID=A0ABU3ZNB7_9GAMM|nr:hypothetical protein [Photobacterium rosenbergii]MDV5171605.1 hypothetical protein [Photobacterium rosenbergii]